MDAGIGLRTPFAGHSDILLDEEIIWAGEGEAAEADDDVVGPERPNQRLHAPGFATEEDVVSSLRAKTGQPDDVAADVAVGEGGTTPLLSLSFAMVLVLSKLCLSVLDA